MRAILTKCQRDYIFHTIDGGIFDGPPDDVRGDLSGIYGDLTAISGDLSGVFGDLSGMTGDLTGIYGDLTEVYGNVDHCELSDEDRKAGVDIALLIRE